MRFRRRRGLGGRRSRGGDDEDGDSPEGEGGSADDRGRGAHDPSASGGGGDRGAVRALLERGGPVRWVAAVAALVLLFGAGYLISAEWLFPASGPQAAAGEVSEVPDMVGLDAEDARAALSGAGLEYRVRSEMSHPEAPAGAVIAQSPLPGQFARPGAPVEVTLSEGPRRRTVPDLRGLSGRQAQIVLERLGFGTSVDTAASEVERGRVVGTRPEAGSGRTLPADVAVVVSRGPDVSDVPELVGLHVDDVEARLRENGFRLGEVTYDPEAFAAPGRVIGQTPAPGYALREGGRVSISVAGSPPEPSAGGEASGGAPGPAADGDRRPQDAGSPTPPR